MTFEEYESYVNRNGFRYRKEDQETFAAISNVLPSASNGEPYYCGPHSYVSMELALMVAKPKSILEIGFNLGHSSLFWLTKTNATVLSTDIRNDAKVMKAVEECSKSGRFEFCVRNELVDRVKNRQFDFAFIDGSHEFNDVVVDIQFCRNLKIPYLLMDDWLTVYGGAQRAVFASGQKIIFTSGNQALVDTQDCWHQVNV